MAKWDLNTNLLFSSLTLDPLRQTGSQFEEDGVNFPEYLSASEQDILKMARCRETAHWVYSEHGLVVPRIDISKQMGFTSVVPSATPVSPHSAKQDLI